jgi:hypothetical protein
MAKKALIQKQQKTPKFKVRGYTRCNRCGRPQSVYRKFGRVASVYVRWHMLANYPVLQKVPGKPRRCRSSVTTEETTARKAKRP